MSQTPLTQLGPLSVADFLQRYWQREAVFLPAALPDFRSPLSPEELAGLALEDEIESRLITHSDELPWQLENGPFDESRFLSLPSHPWTLLIQAVDQLIPDVHQLLQKFRFIPSWRLDDIMVSYAPTGGSVGPHFDYYDVFLLQGAGKREWQIGQQCDSNSPTLEGTPLNILKEFKTQQRFTAGPGDIVYIPPGTAHWGTALDDDCITYSIGFRAPSVADIFDDLSQDIASRLSNDQRYRDAHPPGFAAPGEIDATSLKQLRQLIEEQLTDQALASWFGRYMTTPKYPELCPDPEAIDIAKMQTWIDGERWAQQAPEARFSYLNEGDHARLFVNGEEYTCSVSFARTLCNQTACCLTELSDPAERHLLLELFSLQQLELCDEADG